MDEKLPDLTHLPPRESEMRYFLKHRREWSVEYPRDWVAVVGEEIVALGSDLAIVMAAADLLGSFGDRGQHDIHDAYSTDQQ